MKEIRYRVHNLYCVWENFCDSVYYGSGTVTVINYGSDSAKILSKWAR
jgi:hypothetical protein